MTKLIPNGAQILHTYFWRMGANGIIVRWETMVCHSIREDHKDGFVIPYQQMMEYAQTHPDFDMASITVFAPEDAFNEFSYATEHVSYDAVIDVLQSCIKACQMINYAAGRIVDLS